MAKTVLLIAAILLGLSCCCAYAQALEMPMVYTAAPLNINTKTTTFLDYLNKSTQSYAESPLSKAGDGTINAVSAWIDVPETITDESVKYDLFTGFTIGLGKGIATGVKREAAGIVDFATCVIPPYDKPLMEPAYTVKQPDTEGLKITVLSW